jgi:hypothetical protein
VRCDCVCRAASLRAVLSRTLQTGSRHSARDRELGQGELRELTVRVEAITLDGDVSAVIDSLINLPHRAAQP